MAKKQSLLQKFGRLSEAKKLIVFLLVFAVIGGGYMVYNSYAATAIRCTPKIQVNEPSSPSSEGTTVIGKATGSCNKGKIPNEMKMSIHLRRDKNRDGAGTIVSFAYPKATKTTILRGATDPPIKKECGYYWTHAVVLFYFDDKIITKTGDSGKTHIPC